MPTVFDLDKLKQSLAENEKLLSDPSVYSDVKKSTELSRKIKNDSDKIKNLETYKTKIKNLQDFIAEAEELDDESFLGDIQAELKDLNKKIDEFYITTMLNGEFDSNNAIMKIHSGAGGTEACDWTQMLFRMYKMYCDKNGFQVSVLDYVDGDGAGYKSIEFLVKGDNAYGYLKGEMGVHRLVRISPFDANKRRHTSFASVEVMPELTDAPNVKINEKDLKIDTYRSSGAGGQHVNTTDSAVRITHIPTGIVAACQNERSQMQNKETAMNMLKSKLMVLAIENKKQSINELKGDVKKIEWGSQIRSYVFCPYTLVKDTRTGYETSDLTSVMNGELDEFIFAYLKMQGSKK